jgi:divalent metal cation (Fe/Co/Zn/Cd) transporter
VAVSREDWSARALGELVDDADPQTAALLQAGLRVSAASVVWTVASGATAVVLGVAGNSLVLVAFGAVGMVDAVGSSALVIHFRHARRHEVFSERHERVALRMVTVGMIVVGVSTAMLSLRRLTQRSASDPALVGVALAAVSLLVLAALATRKHRLGLLIPSRALVADGWLSAGGALLALVTVVGTGFTAAFGWWWLDPAAATAVAVAAFGVGLALARD